jgi:DNA-nicking Smr family endonuclease
LSRKRREEPPGPGRFRPFEKLDARVSRPDGRDPPRDKHEEPPESDEEIFTSAVGDVTPLAGPVPSPPQAEPRPARLPDEGREWHSFARDLLKGEAGFDISWSDEFVEGRCPEVGEETMQRLRRGELAWQDHLDLHGLNRLEAREAVEDFIRSARVRNLGCVLIVHGRGKGSSGGMPVLKEKLVAWLARRGGIGSYILAFTTARPCDGGYGATYVLVRGA